MNKRNRERYNRDSLVSSVCTSHSSIVSTNPGFLSLCNELDANLAKIDQRKVIASRVNTGKTEDKELLRDRVEEGTSLIGGALAVFARRSGNNTVLAEAAFSPSELDRLADTALVTKATTIYELATQYKTELESFVDANAVAAFKTRIIEFSDFLAVPREAVRESEVAKKNIADAIRSNAIIIKEMKRTALSFKKDHPEFYDELLLATRIIDLPTSYTALEGNILSNAQAPVSGATVSIQRTDADADPIVFTTGSDGTFVTRVSPGTYTINISRPGYKPGAQSDIVVSRGNTVSLEFILSLS